MIELCRSNSVDGKAILKLRTHEEQFFGGVSVVVGVEDLQPKLQVNIYVIEGTTHPVVANERFESEPVFRMSLYPALERYQPTQIPRIQKGQLT